MGQQLVGAPLGGVHPPATTDSSTVRYSGTVVGPFDAGDSFRVAAGAADLSDGLGAIAAIWEEGGDGGATAEPSDYEVAIAAAAKHVRRATPVSRVASRARPQLPAVAAAAADGTGLTSEREVEEVAPSQAAPVQTSASDGEASQRRAALFAKLQAYADSGALLSLPWLPAASLGLPQAACNDLRVDYLPPSLVPRLANLPSAADPGRHLLPGEWRKELNFIAAAAGRHMHAHSTGDRQPDASSPPLSPELPPAVSPRLLQAASSPVVKGLLRSLTWHRRMAAEAQVSRREQEALANTASDLSDAVKMLLYL